MAYFVIEGKDYEVPETDSLTMGDATVIYDYTGLGLDQIDEGVRHPGLLAAFMHIAYKRGNPDAAEADVKAMVANTRIVSALEKVDGDDAGPPDLTTKPSRRSSGGKPKSSGDDSQTSSDEPDAAPSPTGTSE